MMHPQSGYLLALLFCTIFSPGIDAIAWPEPTPAGLAFDDREWSPWPTGRPFNPLERRQESENNFRTCGYLDALPEHPLTCEGTSVCVTDTFFGIADCCNPDNNNLSPCLPYTACLDEDFAEDCGAACANDPQLLLCTRGDNTICAEISFNYLTTTYTKYLCADLSLSAVAYPTTVGQEVESEDGNPIYSNALGISNGFVVEDAGSGSDDDDDTNVGAIAGGVIGGLVVLGALIGGLTYLFYRKKRQRHNHALATAAATATTPAIPNNEKVVNVTGGGFAPGGGSVSTAGQTSPTYESKMTSPYPPANIDPHQSFYSPQPQPQPHPQSFAPFYQPTSPQQMPPQMVNYPSEMQSVSSNPHMSYISPTSSSPVPQYGQPMPQPAQQQQQQSPHTLRSMPSIHSQTMPQEQQQAIQLDGTQVDKPLVQEASGAQEEVHLSNNTQRANEVP